MIPHEPSLLTSTTTPFFTPDPEPQPDPIHPDIPVQPIHESDPTRC